MSCQPIIVQPCVYVLKLNCDKYYVGITYNFNLRYAQHLAGVAAKWTRLYSPISVVEIITPGTKQLEDQITLKYKEIYGDTNVYGGKYVTTSSYKLSIQKYIDNEEDTEGFDDSIEIDDVVSVTTPINTFVSKAETKKIVIDNSSMQEAVTSDSPKPAKKIRSPISFKKLQEAVLPDPEAEPEADEVKTEIMENTEPDHKKIVQQEYWANQYKKTSETKQKLIEKGKTPEEILTKENLQKWLVDERRSYAYIAREYAGCTNQVVSDIAKGFGLATPFTSKRRYMLSVKGR